MKIVLVTEVIHPGGAETFILRYAEALHQQGHQVRIFIFYKEMWNKDLCKLFAPNVTIIPADIPKSSLLRKVDSLLFRLKIDYSFRAQHIKRSLQSLLSSLQPNVIHSHLLKSDTISLAASKSLQIPVVNTIHGDYLQFYNKTKQGIPIPLLNYQSKAVSNLQQLKRVVCISDKQLQFFADHFPSETNGKLSKIYNGYNGEIKESVEKLKQQLGLKPTDLIYGMVSRGIPDKGWQVAIDAFLKMGKADTHLILVGASEYLTELAQEYATNKQIHFIGHADNPLDWINVMDIGLLPTTYPSESLPTVVIEYLYCGIPVIASNAGEIENMITYDGEQAGTIIPVKDGKVATEEVAIAMEEYYTDKNRYNKHKANANKCYTHFDMNKCIEAYCNVYESAK